MKGLLAKATSATSATSAAALLRRVGAFVPSDPDNEARDCWRCPTVTPPPQKGRAVIVQRDRALWTMLADEVDAYLAGPALPSDADHDPIDYDDPIDEYRHHPTEARP